MSEDEFDIIIDPNRRRSNFRKDLWNYRGLFYFLSWRDILVRYKQTVLGVLWSIIRPLMTIFVFTIIFGRLAKLPSDGVPSVSYTHLRAHETVLDLVCRLLLEKKNKNK